MYSRARGHIIYIICKFTHFFHIVYIHCFFLMEMPVIQVVMILKSFLWIVLIDIHEICYTIVNNLDEIVM